MFGLFGQGAEPDVALEKTHYLPGEKVRARVRVTGTKELTIQGGRVELFWANRYTYREKHRDSKGRVETRTVTTTDEQILATHRFLEGGTIAPDSTTEHTMAFNLPQHVAPPSGEGAISSITWKVRAILDIRMARDVNAEAELIVLSPVDARAAWAGSAPHCDAVEDCEMAFHLPARHVRPGDSIAGTLLLGPYQDLDAQEVRLELVRREIVSREEGNTAETVMLRHPIAGAGSYAANERYELPFQLPVPPEPFYPSLETSWTAVHWGLRAVVNRRFRSDYNLTAELNCYTGPAPGG